MNGTKYRVYICCGPNCGPKGSPHLLDLLAAEVERQGLSEQVSVLPTGCQSHCETGPTMVVYPGPFYYQEMSPERLSRLVQEHFVAGEPVREFFWNGVRKKIVPKPQQPVYTGAETPLRPAPAASARPSVTKPKPQRPTRDVDDFKW